MSLPSLKYALYITDMRSRHGYLDYEEVGIFPDILLQTDQDWIDQAVVFIAGADRFHGNNSIKQKCHSKQ